MSTAKWVRDRYMELSRIPDQDRTNAQIRELIALAKKYEDWGNRTALRDSIRALGLLEDWLMWAHKQPTLCAVPEFLILEQRTMNYCFGRSTGRKSI